MNQGPGVGSLGSGIRGRGSRARGHHSVIPDLIRNPDTLVRTSVIRNFEVGGRPRRWKPLSPVTPARHKGRKILMMQGFAGGLPGSIHTKASKDHVLVGTPKIYGANHQFGAKKGESGRVPVARRLGMAGRSGATLYSKGWPMPVPWGDIPARPFLGVGRGQWREILHATLGYMLKGR